MSSPERLETKLSFQEEGLVRREDQRGSRERGMGKKRQQGAFVGNEVTSLLVLELDWPGLLCPMFPEAVYSSFSFDNNMELETEPESLDLTSEVPPSQGGALTATLAGPAFPALDTYGSIQVTTREKGHYPRASPVIS